MGNPAQVGAPVRGDEEAGFRNPDSQQQGRLGSQRVGPRVSVGDMMNGNRPSALKDVENFGDLSGISGVQQVNNHEVVFYPSDFDGEIIWHARQQRKGLYPTIESYDKNVKVGRTVIYLLSFEPGNISWWVGHTFAWGSVLFVVGGANLFWAGALSEGYYFGELVAFIGAFLFELGGYFSLLEAINPRRELELGYRVKQLGKSKATAESHARGRKSIVEFVNDDDEEEKPQRPWRWIGLDFSDVGKRAASVQFIGTTIYLATLTLGLPIAGTEGGVTLVPYDNIILYDIFMWGGLALGSICFLFVGFTLTLECQYAWYMPNFGSIGWWANFFYFIGACGFMLNAFFGWFYMGRDGNEVCCQHWGTNLSTFWGSCAFFLSSVTLCIECANKHPIPPPSFLVSFTRPSGQSPRASRSPSI